MGNALFWKQCWVRSEEHNSGKCAVQIQQEKHVSICATKSLILDLLVNCGREFLFGGTNFNGNGQLQKT